MQLNKKMYIIYTYIYSKKIYSLLNLVRYVRQNLIKSEQELCKINLTLLSSAIFLYKRCIIHSFLIVTCNNYIRE